MQPGAVLYPFAAPNSKEWTTTTAILTDIVDVAAIEKVDGVIKAFYGVRRSGDVIHVGFANSPFECDTDGVHALVFDFAHGNDLPPIETVEHTLTMYRASTHVDIQPAEGYFYVTMTFVNGDVKKRSDIPPLLVYCAYLLFNIDAPRDLDDAYSNVAYMV